MFSSSLMCLLASVSHWLLQEALVPSLVGISTSFLSALLPWQLAFHQVSCLKKRQLKIEAAVLNNYILKVTYHHFHYVHEVRH